MNLVENIVSAKGEISRNVFIARKALGYNHNDLVRLAGLTRPILSQVENATANPTLETLAKICYALNISLDMLFVTESSFLNLQRALKPEFDRRKAEHFDFTISSKLWKLLLVHSGDDSRKNCSKIAKACAEIIYNSSTNINKSQNNIVLGAALGVIFQQDGFVFGLEFGAWFGNKLKDNSFLKKR